jgi:hypothetical protein
MVPRDIQGVEGKKSTSLPQYFCRETRSILNILIWGGGGGGVWGIIRGFLLFFGELNHNPREKQRMTVLNSVHIPLVLRLSHL